MYYDEKTDSNLYLHIFKNEVTISLNKKEISEIKKQFTPEHCAVTRICGCYVDAEKEKKTELREAFLSLPEEEMFKYFDIFRKTLSGTIGKNLINLNFPLTQEEEGGTQAYLLRLRDSQLKDDQLLEDFYDKVIEHYFYGENYYIILIHGLYDIPGKSSDGMEMFDASDEVYEFLLCSICPVKLSKAGLCYNCKTNCIEDRIRDWIVEMPDQGFLFPVFNDRSTDLHSVLYYSKNPALEQTDFMDQMFGCTQPVSAQGQQDIFNAIVEDTLGDSCDYETVKNIHEHLNEWIEENKDEPEPLSLDKTEVKSLLAKSGASNEHLENFDENFETSAGEKASLLASNVTNTRKFQIKTPDIVIQVNPSRADLVETRVIDGRPCLVIAVDDHVEVNGINVRTITPEAES